MRIKTLALMLAVSTAACYQYYAVPDLAPLPKRGAEIRAQLSPPVSLDLGTVTVHDVSTVEGNVFNSHEDTLAVYARLLLSYDGSRHPTGGAVINFRRSELRQLETQRLSPVRTGIAAGVFGAGVFAIYELIQSARPAETGGEGGGGTNPTGLRISR